MKKVLALVLSALTMASLFTGCISGSETEIPPEPTPTPRVYSPNPFTGFKIDETTYKPGKRAVALMINNISACRPQRGIEDAVILYESKVEGGITRFMGIFENREDMPVVGPVRSGRDQFLRWAMPMQALYAHIGRSGITQTYIDTNNYNDLDLDGQYRVFTYRLDRPGKALEHTAYTDAEALGKAIEKYEYDMNRTYTSPLFNFVDYDVNGGKRELTGDAAENISIVHSETYRTYFDYDAATGRYMMSAYNGSKKVREQTIDENSGLQIGFENVFVAFADIYKYYYPGGGAYDPNYQCVDMDFGGIGYYFANGKAEKIRWFKGGPMDALRFTDMDENPLEVNCGKSYIGFVDLDEYERFEYVGPAQEIVEEQIDNTQESTGEVEFE